MVTVKKKKKKKLTLSEAYLLGKVASAASKDWRAAVWLLEKRNPNKWADKKMSSLEELTVKLADSGLLNKTQVQALVDLSDSTKTDVLNILTQGENNILSGVMPMDIEVTESDEISEQISK
jgi:hypothetical protein